MSTLEQAYRAAIDITRAEAKNFYYGIRLLPPEKRSALCAVYALARRIDDIGDGDLPQADKQAELNLVRKTLDNLGDSSDPVLLAVADSACRFPVPISAFGELIDGVQMDVAGTKYHDFEELVLYCQRVAGSVGRLTLSIFGAVEPQTYQYANQLGIALQQTNILRDLREDLLNNRIYLPQDELDRFGVRLATNQAGELDDPDGRLATLIRFCANRAEDWYALGRQLIPHLDRRSAAGCLAMTDIYHHLLTLIKTSPERVYDRRLSPSGIHKARIAAAAVTKAAL